MVGLTTLGQPRLSEGAQPYPIQQTETLAGGHSFPVPGLGRQVSGSATRAQVPVQGSAIGPPPSIQSSVIDSALHSVLNAVLYSVLHSATPPYLPFLRCFRRYSTGVHFISRLKRRLKKVTWRKPQAKAMSRTLRSLSRSSRRAACRRSSFTKALKL